VKDKQTQPAACVLQQGAEHTQESRCLEKRIRGRRAGSALCEWRYAHRERE